MTTEITREIVMDSIQKIEAEPVAWRARRSEREKWYLHESPVGWWECQPLYDAQTLASKEAELVKALEHVEILRDALEAADGHLSYLGYGDAWERECAMSQGLPDKIEKALQRNQPEPAQLATEVPKQKTKRVACPHCEHRPRGADGLAAHISAKHAALTQATE